MITPEQKKVLKARRFFFFKGIGFYWEKRKRALSFPFFPFGNLCWWGNLNIRLNHTLASSTYKLYFPLIFARISQFMSELPQVNFSPFRSSRANNFRTHLKRTETVNGLRRLRRICALALDFIPQKWKTMYLKKDYYTFVFKKGDRESLCE